MGGGRKLTAAQRTILLAGVDLREQGQRLPELPKNAPQLMTLVREGHKKHHLCVWVPAMSLEKPMCGSDDRHDRVSYKPSADACGACLIEASRIGGVFRDA